MALDAHLEASLRQRTGEAFEQKHAIARWAASVIVPGENILLDAGYTVGALAHELRGFEKLSVTILGIDTMQELADSEGIEVECLGGRLPTVSHSSGATGRGGSGADELRPDIPGRRCRHRRGRHLRSRPHPDPAQRN
jgi:DeoR/GlpR family transcriptional regulator of sugar metabolism